MSSEPRAGTTLTLQEVVRTIGRVDRVEITHWVERGWIVPSRTGAELLFSEVDVARIALVRDLRRDLAVDEETIPLVLALLDQIYALRRRMHALTEAVQAQPEDVRKAVLSLVREREHGP